MKPLSGTARGCEIIRWFSPKLKSFKSFFSYICLQNAQHRRHSRVCQASGALGSGRRGRSGAALPTWPTKATFWFKPAGRFLRGQVQSPRGLSSHPPLSCMETCARAQAHPHPPEHPGTVLGNQSLRPYTRAKVQCTCAVLITGSQQAGGSRRGVPGTGSTERTCPLVREWGAQHILSAADKSGLILLRKGSGQHRQPLAPE